MTHDDDTRARDAPDDDARLDALFRAARHEMPTNHVRERALERALTTAREPTRRAAAVVSVVVALAAAAALVVGMRTRHASTPSVAAETVPPVARTNPSPDLPRAVPAVAPPNSAPTATKSVPARNEQAPNSASTAAPRPAATLGEELAQLEAARSALSAGDPKRALALIERYTRSTRGARLTDEALVLRMDALAQASRRPEASALARDFVAKNPGSPLVDRARAFVTDAASSVDKEGTQP